MATSDDSALFSAGDGVHTDNPFEDTKAAWARLQHGEQTVSERERLVLERLAMYRLMDTTWSELEAREVEVRYLQRSNQDTKVGLDDRAAKLAAREEEVRRRELELGRLEATLVTRVAGVEETKALFGSHEKEFRALFLELKSSVTALTDKVTAPAQHGVIIPTDFQTITTVEADGSVKSTVNMLFMDTLTGKIVMPSEDGAMAEPEHGSPGWTLDTGGQQLVVREDVVEADLYGGVTSSAVAVRAEASTPPGASVQPRHADRTSESLVLTPTSPSFSPAVVPFNSAVTAAGSVSASVDGVSTASTHRTVHASSSSAVTAFSAASASSTGTVDAGSDVFVTPTSKLPAAGTPPTSGRQTGKGRRRNN